MDTAEFFKRHLIPAAQMTTLWSFALSQHLKRKLVHPYRLEDSDAPPVRRPHAVKVYAVKQLQQLVWQATHISAAYALSPQADPLELQRMAQALDHLTVDLAKHLRAWVPSHRWPAHVQAWALRHVTSTHLKEQNGIAYVSPSSPVWRRVEADANSLLMSARYSSLKHDEWTAHHVPQGSPLFPKGHLGYWATLARNADWTAVLDLLLHDSPQTKDCVHPWLRYGTREGRLKARDCWKELFGADQLHWWDTPTQNAFKLAPSASPAERPEPCSVPAPQPQALSAPAVTAGGEPTSEWVEARLPPGVKVSAESGTSGLLAVTNTYHVLDELPPAMTKAARAAAAKMPKTLERSLRVRSFRIVVSWKELGRALQEAHNWRTRELQDLTDVRSRLQQYLNQQELNALQRKLQSTFSADEIQKLREWMQANAETSAT